ncbi:hypothetical protein DPEC_G00367580 [Dallia pectoralis]|nr:hypothetical protein DPEC_G00367580 [Dallia pectoralis]
MLSFSTARVQEWLCLNCQMKRALGIDMTTPRSKSQQQIHSPSHQAKPIVQPQPVLPAAQPKTQPPPQSLTPLNPSPTLMVHQQALRSTFRMAREDQVVPGQSRIPHPGAVPLVGMAKAFSQPDLGEAPLCIRRPPSRKRKLLLCTSSCCPQVQPPQDGLTKLFGFGASLLNQAASTLASVDPLSGSISAQPSSAKEDLKHQCRQVPNCSSHLHIIRKAHRSSSLPDRNLFPSM